MVNLVAAQRPILHGLMKLAGLRPLTIEVEEGTTISFWVPSKSNSPKANGRKKRRSKPTVLLIHGFAAEGIVTWQFQIGSLTKKYAVYVPDLLFFGGSFTIRTERSPAFQAECLLKALDKLGLQKCNVVGFSYGGMVAINMVEQRPELVNSLVISGSTTVMTDSISSSSMERLGFSSSSDLLLPNTVDGLKALLSVAIYKRFWIPNRLYRDYLEVMFKNRAQRAELLQDLLNSQRMLNVKIPKMMLLWGKNDQIFSIDHAIDMQRQMGNDTILEVIDKAGHLAHLERPCVYNKHLHQFLATVIEAEKYQ